MLCMAKGLWPALCVRKPQSPVPYLRHLGWKEPKSILPAQNGHGNSGEKARLQCRAQTENAPKEEPTGLKKQPTGWLFVMFPWE